MIPTYSTVAGRQYKEQVYISGPMTGIPEWNAPAFATARSELDELGFDPFNPATANTIDEAKCWEEYLAGDLTWFADHPGCRTMALLEDWHLSRGSRLEVQWALRHNWLLLKRLDGLYIVSPHGPILQKLREASKAYDAA